MDEPMLVTAVAMPFWVTAVCARLFQHRRYGLWSASVLGLFPILAWSLLQMPEPDGAIARAIAAVVAIGAISAACGVAYRRHQARVDADANGNAH